MILQVTLAFFHGGRGFLEEREGKPHHKAPSKRLYHITFAHAHWPKQATLTSLDLRVQKRSPPLNRGATKPQCKETFAQGWVHLWTSSTRPQAITWGHCMCARGKVARRANQLLDKRVKRNETERTLLWSAGPNVSVFFLRR